MDTLFGKARSMLDLISVFEEQFGEGIEVTDGIRFHGCPACGKSEGDSHKASVRNNRWRCHKCGADGTVVDAQAFIWDCSPLDAAKRICRGDAGGYAPLPAKEAQAFSSLARKQRESMVADCFKKLREACRPYADELNCLSYLTRERKIPINLVREAQKRGMLGFMPCNPNGATSFLLDVFGKNKMEEAGLWRPGAKKSGLAFRPIISFLPGASSAEFRLARPPESDGERKALRYGYSDSPWFWKGNDSKRALVVEGFIDLLSAVAMGFDGDVIGLPGCNNWKLAWFERVKIVRKTERFGIMLDNDANDPLNPGQTWAKKLNEALRGIDFESEIRPLPADQDVNDLLRARTRAA